MMNRPIDKIAAATVGDCLNVANCNCVTPSGLPVIFFSLVL